MNFPLIGRLDIKTAVLTVLFVMFVLPWLLGVVGRKRSGTGNA
jgi:hypothetical protein